MTDHGGPYAGPLICDNAGAGARTVRAKDEDPMSTASSQMSEIAAAAEAMRRHALSFPETHEDFPWEDHRAVKVKGKAFLFMGMSATELSFSVKLPQSRDIALLLSFAKPTGYGLGKSGWVSGLFQGDAKPPVDMLLAWLDESYRAIAPKKLVAQLAARQTTPAEVTTNVEAAKAAKPARATKTAKPARAAKAADVSRTAKPAKAVKSAKTVKSAKAVKSAKPAKVTKTANAPARKAATKKAGGAARKARASAG